MSQRAANMVGRNVCFQMGLLHLAHLLVSVDGIVDDHEKLALKQMMEEEKIPEMIYADFQDNIIHKTEKQVYDDGVDFLNACTELEKLCALVHLYRLSEADGHIHEKEVRLLLYALKRTDIDFDDVELAARMVKSRQYSFSKATLSKME